MSTSTLRMAAMRERAAAERERLRLEIIEDRRKRGTPLKVWARRLGVSIAYVSRWLRRGG